MKIKTLTITVERTIQVEQFEPFKIAITEVIKLPSTSKEDPETVKTERLEILRKQIRREERKVRKEYKR